MGLCVQPGSSYFVADNNLVLNIEKENIMIAGYVRVSTLDQVEYGKGLEIQKDIIKEYCRKNNLKLSKIYEEQGISGGLDKRPALAELQADVAAKIIKTVIINRLDRLARNLLLQESILSDFEERGAKVISIDEPDILSTDPSRVLLRQMKGAINQYEKAMIVTRMKAGRSKKANDGGYPGGAPGLGYKSERANSKSPSYLRVVPEEALLVELIYDLRKEGHSLREIADYLKAKGYKTRRKGKWHASTVKYILNNETYRGLIKHSSIKAEGLHEAIIDPDCILPPQNKSITDEAINLIISEKNKGASFRQIASKLNLNRIPAKKGGKWKAGTVKYLWDRLNSSGRN